MTDAALRAEPTSGQRLVAELRLAQFAALLLTLAAAVPMGFALAHDNVTGTGLVVAIAAACFAVAALVTTWEPVRALTALAVAWSAQHSPTWPTLPDCCRRRFFPAGTRPLAPRTTCSWRRSAICPYCADDPTHRFTAGC